VDLRDSGNTRRYKAAGGYWIYDVKGTLEASVDAAYVYTPI